MSRETWTRVAVGIGVVIAVVVGATSTPRHAQGFAYPQDDPQWKMLMSRQTEVLVLIYQEQRETNRLLEAIAGRIR